MITANRFTPTYDAANEARERARPYPSIIPPKGRRFCIGCQMYVVDHHPQRKVAGWKCDGCRQ